MSKSKYEIIVTNNHNILFEVSDSSGEIFLNGNSLTDPSFNSIRTIGENFVVDNSGNLTMQGNLKVEGSNTHLLTTNYYVKDSLFELGHDASGIPNDYGGFVINRGDLSAVSLYWDESANTFNMGLINSYNPLENTLQSNKSLIFNILNIDTDKHVTFDFSNQEATTYLFPFIGDESECIIITDKNLNNISDLTLDTLTVNNLAAFLGNVQLGDERSDNIICQGTFKFSNETNDLVNNLSSNKFLNLISDPTDNRTMVIPDLSGTLVAQNDLGNCDISSNIINFGMSNNTDIQFYYKGGTSSGQINWADGEDLFQYMDDISMNSSEKIQFRDSDLYIHSSIDGQLDLSADSKVKLTAPIAEILASTSIDLSTNTINFGSTSNVDTVLNFRGDTNTGTFKWMEDEELFQYMDDISMNSSEKIQFRDSDLYIHSSS